MSCQLSKSAKFNKVELVLIQPRFQSFFEEAIHQDGRTEKIAYFNGYCRF
jgi:hypothetical protein